MLALAGVGLICWSGEEAVQFNASGDLLAAAAGFVWAVYSLLIKRITAYGFAALPVTRRIFFYGILCMIPAACLGECSVDVDELLDFIQREEVAAYVQMGSAIAEAGLVVDGDGRQHRSASRQHGDGLAQGLDAVEYAGFAGAVDGHAVGRHLQAVGFRVVILQVLAEDDVSLAFRARTGLVLLARGLFQIFGQEEGVVLHFLAVFRIHDGYPSVQYEFLAGGGGHFLWQWDYLIVGCRFLLVAGGKKAGKSQQPGQTEIFFHGSIEYKVNEKSRLSWQMYHFSVIIPKYGHGNFCPAFILCGGGRKADLTF